MDSSRATILSAHLDSPNCPGALDNGSGSASLLEVARVLDRSRTVPPVDVYLVWFGCHEKGVFGSAHFAATHQELLDRTLGMIELDAMARPLNGLDDPVNLESWSYARLGDNTLPLPEFLQDEAGGEIVALGDIGMLVSQGGEPSNFQFWQNLAQYAASC
jgi:hypothetical protein